MSFGTRTYCKWIKVAAIVSALALCPYPLVAQPSDSTSGQSGHPTAVSVAAFLVGSTLSVYTHELGHYMVGQALGATSSSIKLFPPKTSMVFPNNASEFQTSFPVLAGPLSTRLSAEVLDLVLDRTYPPQWIRTLGGAWYLAMRLDLPFQVLTSSVLSLTRHNEDRRDDVFRGFVGPYFRTNGDRNLAYVGLIAIQVVDLWLTFDQITENVHRLTGDRSQRMLQSNHRVSPFYDAVSGSWGIAYSSTF
jgi:hypothetical protein